MWFNWFSAEFFAGIGAASFLTLALYSFYQVKRCRHKEAQQELQELTNRR